MGTRFIGIIPARYASTRFPGKPLALLQGKPMIQHVCEHVASSTLDQYVVATDDERIYECVRSFGGEVVMTAPSHPSGTDRCGEAARTLQLHDDDVVINIQGDEPFISANEIGLLTGLFDNPAVHIATLVKPIDDPAVATDPNKVKVVTDRDYLQHLGIYAYRYKTLCELVRLTPSPLEQCEKLEQLRWLENGYSIHTASCHYNGIGIDTPADLEHVQNLLAKQNNDL